MGGTTCPTTQSWCQENGFDPFGNRWVSFSNRTLHMATPTSAAAFNGSTNRLTGSGITYDNAGNLTAHPFLTPGAGGGMVYNASNKMTQFTATGVSVSYRYDDKERRVRQDSGGQTTIWVYDAFGQLAAEYATNLTMTQGVYYRTTDHLGSTRIVTNQSAAVVQRRDFFPFGEAIPADSSHGNRQAVTDGGQATYNTNSGVKQQFTGQQRDEETGLDYFKARNYFAPLGRFLSIDPGSAGGTAAHPQSWNSYAYVNNSPCRYSDPTGLYPEPDDESNSDRTRQSQFDWYWWLKMMVTTAAGGQAQADGGNPAVGAMDPGRTIALEGLAKIGGGGFKAKAKCREFFQQLVSQNGLDISAATLMEQVATTAARASEKHHVYNGVGSNTVLTQQSFLHASDEGSRTVGDWFTRYHNRQALSQFDGDAIWIRFGDWHGIFSPFQSGGKANQIGLGTLFHELLHKESVGGGFIGDDHDIIDRALDAVGAPYRSPQQEQSSRLGQICFE
jgi:RHS repeat-associated protein